MNIIVGSPAAGRLNGFLELSAKNNIPILCEDKNRVERLLIKAHGYGYKIPMPITLDEVTPNVREVYVDAIDRLLDTLLPCRVNTFTFNKDDNCQITDLDEVTAK